MSAGASRRTRARAGRACCPALRRATVGERVQSIDQIAERHQRLGVHEIEQPHLEQQPRHAGLRQAIDDQDLMNEAAVEHETAKMLIEQLDSMAADDPSYYATFTVLGEYVRHHVTEEQGEMFPEAKKSGLDLAALGERMRARKEELAGEMA